MGIRTRAFWADVAERAAATFAQTLIPILAADGANLLTLDWPTTLGLAAAAAALSVAKSAAAAGSGERGTASLVSTGRHARPE